MIDFSKYTLREQEVINDVLYDLQRYLWDNEMEWQYLHDAFFYSTMELRRAVDEHAHYAEKKLEPMQAEAPAEPADPAEAVEEWDAAHNKNTEAYKAVVSEPVVPVMADPPAPPDMFGWVGDALDDLCAAGEVIGNDR